VSQARARVTGREQVGEHDRRNSIGNTVGKTSETRTGPGSTEERHHVDVRIGIVQSAKELEIELGDDADRDAVIADIESSLGRDEGVLWLTDRKGRRVAVPVAKVAYVEVGAPTNERRVGFGAP
jgi:hypothetical protein